MQSMLKFTQNLDLQAVLLNTGRAKLLHFSRSASGSTEDILLMRLRQTLLLNKQ